MQADADEKWRFYEQLSGVHRNVPHLHARDGEPIEAGQIVKGDEA